MDYTIKVSIPDELVGLLSNTDVQKVINDLGLKALSAGPTPEPEITVAQLNTAAKAACATPEGRDAARAVIAEMGYPRLADVPKEKWGEVMRRFNAITEGGRTDA